MPITKDDFELETGLASDFNGSIIGARFGVNEEYAAIAGTQDPMLILAIDAPELGIIMEQAYSLGGAKQWGTTRDGREVVSGKNPDSHRYNMSSRGGMLVAAMIETVGKGDKGLGQEFFTKRGHLMTQAECYEGLNFHWNRKSVKTVGGDESNVLLPDAFLGLVDTGLKPAVTGTVSSVSSSLTPSVGTTPAPVSDEVVAQIVALAPGKTERELKMAVMKDESLKANDEVKNLVFNKGLLAALEAEGALTRDPEGKYI